MLSRQAIALEQELAFTHFAGSLLAQTLISYVPDNLAEVLSMSFDNVHNAVAKQNFR
ncbi:hypothetical protein [Pseudomonas sp. zfem002]|uniref:hypothetical protein n=1 Tax=Pseudomonas sp. zfem002 TaxID=3078197 RepID=UPI0029281747|nr:hypothetical protein [Pseudomonas sp. zfem002]MDU9390056.1 hypothetical protein [Pseudomonas sp. zfem002]